MAQEDARISYDALACIYIIKWINSLCTWSNLLDNLYKVGYLSKFKMALSIVILKRWKFLIGAIHISRKWDPWGKGSFHWLMDFFLGSLLKIILSLRWWWIHQLPIKKKRPSYAFFCCGPLVSTGLRLQLLPMNEYIFSPFLVVDDIKSHALTLWVVMQRCMTYSPLCSELEHRFFLLE